MNPGQMDMILRLRKSGIHDINVLRAFETVAREHYVEPADRARAYDETSLPLPCASMLPKPFALAVIMQSGQIKAEHKVLVVGEGSGYLGALCGALSARAYVVQRYQRLLLRARHIYAQTAITNVTQRHGDGSRGWGGQAPFDRILVSGNIAKIPGSLMNQLTEDGRIAAIVSGQLSVLHDSQRRDILPLDMPDLESGKSKAL